MIESATKQPIERDNDITSLNCHFAQCRYRSLKINNVKCIPRVIDMLCELAESLPIRPTPDVQRYSSTLRWDISTQASFPDKEIRHQYVSYPCYFDINILCMDQIASYLSGNLLCVNLRHYSEIRNTDFIKPRAPFLRVNGIWSPKSYKCFHGKQERF